MSTTGGTLSPRDSFCELGNLQIPRPKCNGFQFVPTRGRMGFYRSIKRDGEKYGVQIKSQCQRRPGLPNLWQNGTDGATVPEPNNNNNCKTVDSRPQSKQLNFNVSADNFQHKPTSVQEDPTFGCRGLGMGKRPIFRRQAPLSMYTGMKTPIRCAIQEEPEFEHFGNAHHPENVASGYNYGQFGRTEKC
uniref:Myozenin-3 n=1 Tax=Panagrellus redivivus TaxID=6233 RepID=A0A7E4VL56_PANRE